MRDRLKELLEKFEIKVFADFNPRVVGMLAEHLLANGVVLFSCKVGDAVYQTDGIRIYELEVSDAYLNLKNYKPHYDTESIGFDDTAIGESIFLTREQAEQALAEMQK